MGNTFPRLSKQSLQVLFAFADDPTRPHSGAELMAKTRISSGSIYPILFRFENCGWLESNWEAEEPSLLGRPRRRLYRISGSGVAAARDERLELSGLGFAVPKVV